SFRRVVPEPVEGLNERYTHYFWDSLFFLNQQIFYKLTIRTEVNGLQKSQQCAAFLQIRLSNKFAMRWSSLSKPPYLKR
ncbi:MAG: hypothetical protein UHJ46_03585, partial [Treponema sp.]|nr:hypothetical protein [Treponema sp.]